MARRDTVPSIPPIPAGTDAALRPMLQAIRDTLMTRSNQTKNFWDHSPTMRELFDSGIIDVFGNPGSGNAIIRQPGNGDPSDNTDPFDEFTVPPAPTGFTVFATPWAHFLSWDFLTGNLNLLVSYTEIWVNTIDDRSGATLVGTSEGNVYTFIPEPDTTVYFWIRFMSFSGVSGEWNAAAGTEAIAGPDPSALLRVLTDEITETQLFDDLNDRIDLIDNPSTGLVDQLNAEKIARLADVASLSLSIDNIQTSISANVFINGFEVADIGDWVVPTDNTLAADTTDELFGIQAGLATFDHATAPPYEPDEFTEVLRAPIPIPTGIAFSGAQLRVRIFAKQPTTNATAEFAIGYAVDNDTSDVSGWQKFTPTDEWTLYDFIYSAPATVTEADQSYIVLWADTANSGKALLVDNASVDIDGSVQDLSGITTNATAISLLSTRIDTNDGITSGLVSDFTALNVIVTDPLTGNAALGIAASTLESRVTVSEGVIAGHTSAINAINNSINDVDNGLAANATAISTLTSDVASFFGSVTANSARITSLESTVNNGVTGVLATSSALSALSTSVISNDLITGANSTAITSLQDLVDDPVTGNIATSSALQSLDSRVTSTETEITAASTSLTSLESQVAHGTTGLEATNFVAQVGLSVALANRDEATSQAALLTTIQAQINDPLTLQPALAGIINSIETEVTSNADGITAQATQFDLITTTVGENTASIATTQTSVDGVGAQYTVKLDVNGRVAGFGLANDGKTDYSDTYIGQSQFFVSVDTFAIYNPDDIGDTPLAFVVDTINNRVVMDGAFIREATINSAAIQTGAILNFHLGTGSVQEANILDANITNAKIGNFIQSASWIGTSGPVNGWLIDKNGFIHANAIRIYDNDGDIIMGSGDGTGEAVLLGAGIDNSQQQYADILSSPNQLSDISLSEAQKLADVAIGATANTVTTSGIDPTSGDGAYGDLWYNFNNNKMWMKRSSTAWSLISVNEWDDIFDENSTKPADGATVNRVDYGNGALGTGLAAFAVVGDVWFNTDNGELNVWRGSSWEITADATQQHFSDMGGINPSNRATYLAEAVIDTLWLNGQAVTFPEQINGTNRTAGNSWETITDSTYNPQGGRVNINCTFQANLESDGGCEMRVLQGSFSVIASNKVKIRGNDGTVQWAIPCAITATSSASTSDMRLRVQIRKLQGTEAFIPGCSVSQVRATYTNFKR